MANFYAQQTPRIQNGKLVLVSNGGSIELIGIRGVRASIRQIEASSGPLAETTKERLAVLRDAAAMWAAR